MTKEYDVEKIVREYVQKKYIEEKNWRYTKKSEELKTVSEHGADIVIYNQIKGDRMVIEVKKWSKTCAANHNAFYTLFGQILSRIYSVPSEIYSKRRKMVFAVPTEFFQLIKKKVNNVKNGKFKGMHGGWTLFGEAVNLRIWEVNMKTKEVKEHHWKKLMEK
jgi:hypothetical protein